MKRTMLLGERPKILPSIAAMALLAIVAGCGAALSSPTQLVPAGDSRIEVAWDSQADESLVITIGQGGDLRAYATVDPCAAANMIVFLDPPFQVGLGSSQNEVSRPMPMIVDSEQLDEVDGEYRLLIQIDPDRSPSLGVLRGDAISRPAGDC